MLDCAERDRRGSQRSLVAAATAFASVRGTEFKEGSVLVGDTLDYDGFDVIAAPTRHQVWHRGHRFSSQCKFDIGYGSIELLWKVFLHRLVLTEVKEEYLLMECVIPIIAAMFRFSSEVLYVYISHVLKVVRSWGATDLAHDRGKSTGMGDVVTGPGLSRLLRRHGVRRLWSGSLLCSGGRRHSAMLSLFSKFEKSWSAAVLAHYCGVSTEVRAGCHWPRTLSVFKRHGLRRLWPVPRGVHVHRGTSTLGHDLSVFLFLVFGGNC